MTTDSCTKEELFSHLTTYVQAVMPFLGDDFIDRLRGMISNRGAYGVTGLIILLITSGLVFRTLELAFARVFKTKRQRSMVASQLLFVVFLLAVGLPDCLGTEGIERLNRSHPGLPVIALLLERDDRLAHSTLAAGAVDFLVEDIYFRELWLRAIRYGR